MKSEILKKENNIVTMKITIDQDTFEKGCQTAYQSMKGKINVSGFRKGKVPRNVIEKMYGVEVFYDEAINAVLPKAYEEAVAEQGLDIVSRPDVDVEEIGKGKDLVLTVSVTVKPEVTLGAYKGIEVEKKSVEVTAEEIDQDIEAKREQNARFIAVEDRAVQEKDMLLIDFNGKVDNVEFPGGQAENYSIVVGSGTFIPGFEDQLVGMNLGEEKDIEVTFPEAYHEASLAGKPAVFTVKVNEIKEKELPELDDEFVKDISEFDTLDELKADVKEKLTEKKSKEVEREVENYLIKTVSENATIDIPEVMIETQMESMLKDFEYQLRYQGLSIEDYFTFSNTTKEQLTEQMRPDAEMRVRQGLVIETIGKTESIDATEEDLDQEMEKMAETYKMSAEQLKKTMRPQDIEYIKDTVVARKIVDFLKTNAVIK